MTTSPFTITPTPPTTVKVARGDVGTLSFSLTSLKAPDQAQEVMLQALLFVEDRGKEVDWLTAGPSHTLGIAGSETKTVTITARPTATSPGGEHTIKLAVADKEHPNDVVVYSAPVTCEVVDKPGVTEKKKFPKWLIPVIVGGVLVLGGVTFALMRWLSHPGLGDPCDPASEKACGDELICSAESKKCLVPGGTTCKQDGDCDSGECVNRLGICAARIGLACDPADLDLVPCVKESHCDATGKICVKNACRPGDKQCSADRRSLSTCQADGTFKTEPCPASAALCLDGKCQCAANQGQACNCGGVVQCDGSCSKPPCTSSCVNGQCCAANAGAPCGQCGGVFRCDGTCNVATPPNLNQPCGQCGGRVKCDGTCSIPGPPNLNQPCGECGGKIQCNGTCSITAPRCPPGFVIDPRVANTCRSTAETEVRKRVPIPAGCNLRKEETIAMTCGSPDSVQWSHKINSAGGLAFCDGSFATSNLHDCSVHVRLIQPPPLPPKEFCPPGNCDISIKTVKQRQQCTN